MFLTSKTVMLQFAINYLCKQFCFVYKKNNHSKNGQSTALPQSTMVINLPANVNSTPLINTAIIKLQPSLENINFAQ